MQSKDFPSLTREELEASRYDYGYQSIHFHLKQQKERMIPTQIMMAVRINGCRYRLYTGLKVEPAFWNTAEGCCRSDEMLSPRARSRAAGINDALGKLRKAVDKADISAAEHDKSLSPEDLRAVLRDVVPHKKNHPGKGHRPQNHQRPAPGTSSPLSTLHLMADRFDSEVSSKGIKGSSSSRKTYLFCWERLADFVQKTHYDISDFSKFDLLFYNTFMKWLYDYSFKSPGGSKKYCSSTVRLSLNAIRNLHHKAFQSGFTNIPTCREIYARTPSDQQSSKVYLDELELRKLRNVPARSNVERKVLDMFLLASYTGLRISDINRLDEAAVSDSVICLFQKKTGGHVSIPILKEAAPIVKKYLEEGFPKLNPGYANRVIRKLCRDAGLTDPIPLKEYRGGEVVALKRPKYELVSFHTARRSCITNLFRRGYSPNHLMTMSGHKSISSFQRYIRSSADELTLDFVKELRKRNAL